MNFDSLIVHKRTTDILCITQQINTEDFTLETWYIHKAKKSFLKQYIIAFVLLFLIIFGLRYNVDHIKIWALRYVERLLVVEYGIEIWKLNTKDLQAPWISTVRFCLIWLIWCYLSIKRYALYYMHSICEVHHPFSKTWCLKQDI